MADTQKRRSSTRGAVPPKCFRRIGACFFCTGKCVGDCGCSGEHRAATGLERSDNEAHFGCAVGVTLRSAGGQRILLRRRRTGLRKRNQHLLFSVYKRRSVVTRELETVAVG